jgi:3-oxoacyl-[acyl-carrier-protein] synthase-3
MIATPNGVPVSITGLGCHVPDRVVTNDDLAMVVDTNDEWIRTRTGIRERRYAAADEALSDVALPAAQEALEKARVSPHDLDLLVVATVTPDMVFPSTAAILADELGAVDAAAFDLSAGCTGFMYGITQAAGMVGSGLSRRALVIGADVLSKVMNMADRSTCVLFGDGAGAVVIEPVQEQGFLGFELGADGSGGVDLNMPAGGSRLPASAQTVEGGLHYVHMNGRQVFKFATRVLVSSAQKLLDETGVAIEDVDVYVPHQANVRIIDHAVAKLGIPEERVVVNVDRYGNTSSASIPLALADAVDDGRVQQGSLVLMTGMGAGLTWGSALLRWTEAS